jgi:hypothetical protein
MNLLTNGFANNCGRLFGPSEQFEADIVELLLNGFSPTFGLATATACTERQIQLEARFIF